MKYAYAVLIGVVTATQKQDKYTFELGSSSGSETVTHNEDTNEYQKQGTWEKGDNYGREFGVYKDCEDQECKTARVEQINKVSDYLFYSLDTWGQENPASEQPQCNTDESCGGLGVQSRNKCCASISISEKWSNKENYYIYRCMDKALVSSSMNFNL